METNIVQCLDCSIIYTKPTLVPETNPYATETSEKYFQLHNSKKKTWNGESLAAFATKALGRSGKMLELGCGRGELLVGAARCNWQVYGVEMTEDFARAARANGVQVECSSIQDCESLNLPEKYDAILLAAVLEHLYDPHETLTRINRALLPGGLLFIDVPNELSLAMRIGNLYMRARGRDWSINLSPTFSPFHVVGFSPTSLKQALRLTGFRIHTLDVCKWNNDLPKGASIAEKIEGLSLGTVQSLGSSLGMGDGITCWAVRE